jgi:hypothetical protein
MGRLEPNAYRAWRCGHVPYLERVFQGSLSKANRILRLIGFHAHDLNMIPSYHRYPQDGEKTLLRFSKTGDPNVEKAYARHFRWNQSPEKKHRWVESTLAKPGTPVDRKAVKLRRSLKRTHLCSKKRTHGVRSEC